MVEEDFGGGFVGLVEGGEGEGPRADVGGVEGIGYEGVVDGECQGVPGRGVDDVFKPVLTRV